MSPIEDNLPEVCQLRTTFQEPLTTNVSLPEVCQLRTTFQEPLTTNVSLPEVCQLRTTFQEPLTTNVSLPEVCQLRTTSSGQLQVVFGENHSRADCSKPVNNATQFKRHLNILHKHHKIYANIDSCVSLATCAESGSHNTINVMMENSNYKQ